MLNEAICSVCGAVQGGGSGPGLNFVFTLETGTETTGAWSSDRSRGSPAAWPPGDCGGPEV